MACMLCEPFGPRKLLLTIRQAYVKTAMLNTSGLKVPQFHTFSRPLPSLHSSQLGRGRSCVASYSSQNSATLKLVAATRPSKLALKQTQQVGAACGLHFCWPSQINSTVMISVLSPHFPRGQVLDLLQADHQLQGSPVECSVLELQSAGDIDQTATLRSLGQGAFTQELDARVVDGRASFAVHSLKDAPVTLPDGLVLAACLPREDVRDVLISLNGARSLGESAAALGIGGEARAGCRRN